MIPPESIYTITRPLRTSKGERSALLAICVYAIIPQSVLPLTTGPLIVRHSFAADRSGQVCTATCVDVTLKVVLDKIGAAIANPDAQWFERRKPEANAAYFLQNLKTLADSSTKAARIKLRVDRGAEISKFLLGLQALKWEFIAGYLSAALEEAWPVFRLAGPVGQVVLGVFDPATPGYGSAFEFCYKSSDAASIKEARSFVMGMMQTYDPATFKAIAGRRFDNDRCADVMAGLLATTP